MHISLHVGDCENGQGLFGGLCAPTEKLWRICVIPLTHCPLFVAHGCLLTVLHCYHPPLPKAVIVAFCLCKTFNLPLDILYLDQFQIK